MRACGGRRSCCGRRRSRADRSRASRVLIASTARRATTPIASSISCCRSYRSCALVNTATAYPPPSGSSTTATSFRNAPPNDPDFALTRVSCSGKPRAMRWRWSCCPIARRTAAHACAGAASSRQIAVRSRLISRGVVRVARAGSQLAAARMRSWTRAVSASGTSAHGCACTASQSAKAEVVRKAPEHRPDVAHDVRPSEAELLGQRVDPVDADVREQHVGGEAVARGQHRPGEVA